MNEGSRGQVLLEILEKHLSACLYHLLEAASILCLVSLTKVNVSSDRWGASLQCNSPVTSLTLLSFIVITRDPPRQSRIISPSQCQLISNLNPTFNFFPTFLCFLCGHVCGCARMLLCVFVLIRIHPLCFFHFIQWSRFSQSDPQLTAWQVIF